MLVTATQSSDPLRYRNVGGTLLANRMADLGLIDFRRDQLENEHEPTRLPLGEIHTKKGPDVVASRLDRFYIPGDDAHSDLLPSLQLRWDIVWKKGARDHAVLIMTLEDSTGDMGHARHTIDETLCDRADVKTELVNLANDIYRDHSTEKEWEKWERTPRPSNFQEIGGVRICWVGESRSRP